MYVTAIVQENVPVIAFVHESPLMWKPGQKGLLSAQELFIHSAIGIPAPKCASHFPHPTQCVASIEQG